MIWYWYVRCHWTTLSANGAKGLWKGRQSGIAWSHVPKFAICERVSRSWMYSCNVCASIPYGIGRIWFHHASHTRYIVIVWLNLLCGVEISMWYKTPFPFNMKTGDARQCLHALHSCALRYIGWRFITLLLYCIVASCCILRCAAFTLLYHVTTDMDGLLCGTVSALSFFLWAGLTQSMSFMKGFSL